MTELGDLLDLFRRATMGCICAKEKINIDGSTYTVREQIAEGGFSTIHLVTNSHTGEPYAMKRVTCHSTEDQIAAQKEIDFHSALDHPNVLKCVKSKIEGNADIVHNKTSEAMLVLPYYARGTLHDELERRHSQQNPFSESTALELFLSICDGVQHMHSAEPHPLAHRDLKPHNILLAKDLRPVVMDLGSMSKARVKISTHSEAQHLQDVAAERCSMPYRPPELFQVNSKCDIDERTDVWSLGCLLFAICFYKSPFDCVYERGDSVALAVQSNSVKIPKDSAYSTDVHNAILWMLTPGAITVDNVWNGF
jgi:serine/threonine kinase 16